MKIHRLISLLALLFGLQVGVALAQRPAAPRNLSIQPTIVAFYGLTPGVSITGPALQTLSAYDYMAVGPNGEIYIGRGDSGGRESAPPGIYVLESGKVSCIVCNERRGFRDGPAASALFDPQGQISYPGSLDIAVDKNTGIIYAADGYNHRIRKIYKDNGQWMVSTFAGGGSTTMQEGQNYMATDIDLTYFMAITVDVSGNVWTSPNNQLVRITPSGTARIMYQDHSSPYMFSEIVDLDCDNAGNIYGVTRSVNNAVVKYSSSGQATMLNGTATPRTWDGPVETATFNCPSYLAVAPDGSAIYVGGGDEIAIRRIENGRVSSLQENGTWLEVLSLDIGYANQNGWALGAPRIVDQSGYLYVAYGMHLPRPLRKMLSR